MFTLIKCVSLRPALGPLLINIPGFFCGGAATWLNGSQMSSWHRCKIRRVIDRLSAKFPPQPAHCFDNTHLSHRLRNFAGEYRGLYGRYLFCWTTCFYATAANRSCSSCCGGNCNAPNGHKMVPPGELGGKRGQTELVYQNIYLVFLWFPKPAI